MSDIYGFLDNVINIVRKKIELKRKLNEKIEKINIVESAPKEYQPIYIPLISNKYEKRKKKREKKKIYNISLVNIPSENTKITEKDKLRFFIELYNKNENVSQFRYPLTRMNIFGREYIFAYADISWDNEYGELVYHVIEPNIDDNYRKIINTIIDDLIRTSELPLGMEKNEEYMRNYIIKQALSIIKEKGYKIDANKLPYILYYIIRDTIGYGIIDPLMRDSLIEDISCTGINYPIFIFHRNPLIGEIKTNLQFNSDEELDNFVIKLSVRAGRIVSVANPLLDAALPDGSRIQITFGKDISRRGSSFTIRKFTEDPFTPVDLLLYGTVDFNMLAYLWTLIEEGRSLLISGGTATGKTSFLNAISLFIKPEKKIISIEDTAELKLPHPNWLSQVARPGYGPNRYGEVTMFDLLKAALRQRPDYIIVGEVRGEEAYILFQAMATGHAGLGTIHAESFEALMDRLLSPPISLPPALLEVLDGVVFLKRLKYQGKYVRRVDKIYEILGFNKEKKDVDRIISFKWNPRDDTYIAGESYVLNKIAEIRNWDKSDIETNFKFKIRVLEYMLENNIRNYRKIAEIMSMYHNNPDKLMSLVGF